MSWILAASLLVACSRERGPLREAAGNERPVRGGTLVFADPDDLRTLDPAVAYDEVSWVAERLVFDTLLQYDDALRLVPALAERWEVSGATWTFHLRDDVRFHNGRPMVAGDVVYSWNRLFDPALASPGADFFGVIEGADAVLAGEAMAASGLAAPDDHTVTVRLVAPQASFGNVVAMFFGAVVPREEVEARGDRWRYAPVGTGPFAVTSWDLGDKTVFERSPHAWDPPHLDRIVHQAHWPDALQFLKLEADELHQLNRLTSPDWLWVRQNPRWAPFVDVIPQVDTYGETMNTEIPPFDDVWFRRAVSSAIDRDKIARLRNGRARPTSSWLPPQLPGYREDLPYQRFDPKLARECLEKAGYPEGYPTTIPYWTVNTEAAMTTALSVQQDLAAVGIPIEIRNVTFPAYLDASGTRGRMAMGYAAWVIDYPDPENFLEPKFTCAAIAETNSTNDSFWCDPAFDALLAEAKQEPDPDRRRALYEQAQELLAAAAPYAFEYHSLQVNVRQPYVQGVRLHPVYTRDLRHAWLDL